MGEPITSARALEWGLINEVVAGAAFAKNVVFSLAEKKLLQMPATATQKQPGWCIWMKDLNPKSPTEPATEAYPAMSGTPGCQEGLSAFAAAVLLALRENSEELRYLAADLSPPAEQLPARSDKHLLTWRQLHRKVEVVVCWDVLPENHQVFGRRGGRDPGAFVAGPRPAPSNASFNSCA